MEVIYTVKRNPETKELEAVPDSPGHKIIKHSEFVTGMVLEEGQKLKVTVKDK